MRASTSHTLVVGALPVFEVCPDCQHLAFLPLAVTVTKATKNSGTILILLIDLSFSDVFVALG